MNGSHRKWKVIFFVLQQSTKTHTHTHTHTHTTIELQLTDPQTKAKRQSADEITTRCAYKEAFNHSVQVGEPLRLLQTSKFSRTSKSGEEMLTALRSWLGKKMHSSPLSCIRRRCQRGVDCPVTNCLFEWNCRWPPESMTGGHETKAAHTAADDDNWK